MQEQPNNKLHGITLETILNELVAKYGWPELGYRIRINCFLEEFLFQHPGWPGKLPQAARALRATQVAACSGFNGNAYGQAFVVIFFCEFRKVIAAVYTKCIHTFF